MVLAGLAYNSLCQFNAQNMTLKGYSVYISNSKPPISLYKKNDSILWGVNPVGLAQMKFKAEMCVQNAKS